jgi:hypothetical protein
MARRSFSAFGARLLAGAGLLAALALGCALPSSHAQAAVRSEVDANRVGVEDQVQLTVTVEGGSYPDQIPPPPLSNLRVVGGPSVSTQMSLINGSLSQSRSWTWWLQPSAPGRAEIGAVQVRVGSNVESAPAIAIEVVAGSVKPQQAPQRTMDPFARDPMEEFFGRSRVRPHEPRLFVEVRPSRTSLYVGEPLLLTYSIYTQTSLSGLEFANAPQYTGFWVEDLQGPQNQAGQPATVEGIPYRRFTVMLKLLFPTRAGRLTIPAASVKVGIPRQSLFDQGSVVERSTKPLTVDVKPIPDAPGFSGAVGRFRASATIDRPTVALGEAATLRFRVEGTGNLKWVEKAPELNVTGARVYPPQAKSDLKAQAGGIVGSRTWEFVVVPQTTGTIEIPALPFSYFDPAAGRIVRSETAPLPLRVEGGTASATIPLPAPASGAARPTGTLPLRADLDAGGPGALRLPGGVVGLIAGACLLLHAGLWGAAPLARRLAAARTGPGPRGPRRDVRGALRDLERIGRDGMSKEKAAGLIERTIHGVFGSLDGTEDERARAVRQLLDDVQLVRYAPQLGDYSERLRELAARAGDVLRRWA